MIQICKKCTGSFCEALYSLWLIPVPALIRWTSPTRMTELVPVLSLCANGAFEHVGDDFHVAVRVSAESGAGERLDLH